MIYFHHISLAFDHVIPLRICYCMLLIPGVKQLMHVSLLWLGSWTWQKPLTVHVNHDILLDKLAHYGDVGS